MARRIMKGTLAMCRKLKKYLNERLWAKYIFCALLIIWLIIFGTALLGYSYLNRDDSHAITIFAFIVLITGKILPACASLLGALIGITHFKEKNSEPLEADKKIELFFKIPLVELIIIVCLVYSPLSLVSAVGQSLAEENIRDSSIEPQDHLPQPDNAPPFVSDPLYIEYNLTIPFFAAEKQSPQEIACNIIYTLQQVEQKKAITQQEIFNSDYSYYAGIADQTYRPAQSNYQALWLNTCSKYPSRTDIQNWRNALPEWINVLKECIGARQNADAYLQLAINQKLIGLYYVDLYDALVNFPDEETAYPYLLEALKYTAIALESSISEGNADLALKCIEQIDSIYYDRLSKSSQITPDEKEMIEIIREAYRIVKSDIGKTIQAP